MSVQPEAGSGLTERQRWADIARGMQQDLAAYADALPALVQLGVRVPRQWAQERLAIPEPEDGEDVLGSPPAAPAAPAAAPGQARILVAKAR